MSELVSTLPQMRAISVFNEHGVFHLDEIDSINSVSKYFPTPF